MAFRTNLPIGFSVLRSRPFLKQFDSNNNASRVADPWARPCNIRRGRPRRLRWIGAVEKDCLVIITKNWRSLTAGRGGWKRLVQKTLAHTEPSHHG
ncbi:hypothetical protein TNCV_4814941 [Trichonephila clavipes]|nr:hypothetical protein TNCV_4814941 [Trichonephila clavipes]